MKIVEVVDQPNNDIALNLGFPVSQKLFYDSAKQKGYVPNGPSQTNPIMYVKSKNGVKTEIKVIKQNWYFVSGYGLTPEEITYLKTAFSESGFQIVDTRGGKNPYIIIKGNANAPDQILKEFWEIVRKTEDIKEIQKQIMLRGMSSLVPPSDFRYFYGIATQLYYAVRFGLPHMLPRGGSDGSSPGSFDIKDHLLVKGVSPNGKKQIDRTGKAYREHVVPSDLILRKSVEIAKQSGMTAKERIREIAKLLKKYLIIVLISNEEAYNIDYELKWKTTMPPGWNWGDDPYARLTQAGIAVEAFSIKESDQGNF